MNVYGYLRVSTEEQDNEKFKSEILHYANSLMLGNVEWVEEKVSGTVDWKQRALGNLLNNCTDGDIIIVSELSRLARSISKIFEIIEYCISRKIMLHVLKQRLVIKEDQDITTKVMISTFAMIAELERDFISLRTKEALKNRKEQGITLGRPKGSRSSSLDQYREDITFMLDQGISRKRIAERFHVTYQTLYNWIQVQEGVVGF